MTTLIDRQADYLLQTTDMVALFVFANLSGHQLGTEALFEKTMHALTWMN